MPRESAKRCILICSFILALVGAGLAPARAAAARPSGTLLFARAHTRNILAGDQQKVWVHSMAFANVTLKVDYGNGQVISETGKTNGGGIHQFEWTVAYTGTAVALARYWVYATRDAISTATRGDFVLFPPAPLQVRVNLLTPRIRVGDTFHAQVHSREGVLVTLRLRDTRARDLLIRSTRLGPGGAWDVSAPISSTITHNESVNVIVTGRYYGRQTVTTTMVTLRPQYGTWAPPAHASAQPQPLASPRSIAAARKAVDTAAGGSLSVAQNVASTAVQSITVDLQVLGQWTPDTGVHGVAYYQGLLRAASGYADYVNAAAQTISDDAVVQAQMRLMMPHKAVMVSLGEQVLRAYEDGHLVMFTYITTGRPQLPTVTGHFHIYEKVTPFKFTSPWPQGSPFYYPPTWIKYWMPFFEGYGLHDAWWRAHYGPGTNVYGDGPASGEPTGTHGCVNIPYDKTQWLWGWAPVGTSVVVYGGPSVKAGAAGI